MQQVDMTDEQALALGGRSVITDDGTVRVYFDERIWHEWAVLLISRYHQSGRVAEGRLGGRRITRSQAEAYAQGKVFAADGKLWFEDTDPVIEQRIRVHLTEGEVTADGVVAP